MKQNVLIDPYMFYLKNEIEIQKNIPFFQNVIRLCNRGRISVIVYQGLLEKISNRHSNPFPIGIHEVQDSELKNLILILNHDFVKVLSTGITGLEIEACQGTQEFHSEPNLNGDSEYYELLSVMLSPCYNKGLHLAPFVLIGNIDAGRKNGDKVVINCRCDTVEFEKEYEWCQPDIFEDEKDKAFDILQKMAKNNEISFVKIPETVRAEHHCPLQNKAISQYSDFSTRNKAVLALLRYFGLFKIILTEFHEDSSYVTGSIIVNHVQEGADCDIVEGWLFCQTGFKSGVKLYFPRKVGRCLVTYADKVFSYEKIERLKSKL